MSFADRVVVVTGAGSGIGRATAAEVEERGGEALVVPVDVWVNDAMTTVFSFFEGIEPEECARHRCHLPRHGLGHAGGAEADASARPGHDRRGRLGDGLPGDPPAGPLLRCQARDQGLRRLAALGAAPPGLRGPRDDGAAARRQHAAVPPRPLEDAEPPDAGGADLPTRDRRRRDPLRGRPPAPQVYVGASTLYTVLGAKLAPWRAERYLARTAVDGQLDEERPPTALNRNGGKLMEAPGENPGAHGSFDEKAHERSPAWWLSRHRGVGIGAIGAAGAVVGAVVGALLRTRGMQKRPA